MYLTIRIDARSLPGLAKFRDCAHELSRNSTIFVIERNDFHVARSLPSLLRPLWSILMLKITRVADKERTTLIVSGRIDAEQLPDLRRFVEAEQENKVTLDLAEVSLVDAEVVRFLLLCEKQGISLLRCPAYVREWMVREKRSQ